MVLIALHCHRAGANAVDIRRARCEPDHRDSAPSCNAPGAGLWRAILELSFPRRSRVPLRDRQNDPDHRAIEALRRAHEPPRDDRPVHRTVAVTGRRWWVVRGAGEGRREGSERSATPHDSSACP